MKDINCQRPKEVAFHQTRVASTIGKSQLGRAEAGEGAFGANAGLPTVALDLLKPISEKYCPDVISNADLWVLAANVATEVMVSLDYLNAYQT